jgi:hypothetical protein
MRNKKNLNKSDSMRWMSNATNTAHPYSTSADPTDATDAAAAAARE